MFRLISKKLVTAIIIVPFLALFVTNIKSLADFDDIRFAIIAEITKIQGERELWVKISGVRSPAKEGSKLHKYRDTLTINNTPETFAILNFLSQDNKDLGLYVKADSRSVGAIYHFPCAFKGGQFLFGWKLARKENKACYKGIKVIKSNDRLSSQKQIYSQSSPRKINYCVSETESGKSFLAITSGDPCKKAVAKCKKNNKSDRCSPTTVGHWWNTEPNLTAIIRCDDRSELLQIQGSGAKISQSLKQLWQKTRENKAKSCGLEIYSPEDIYVAPAKGINEEIMVKTKDTDACPEVKVIYGAIILKSASHPQGELLKAGEKSTNNFCQTNQDKIKTEFDLEKERKSIDVEILLADREGLAFCSQQQVSGGTEGDERTIQLTAKQGTVKLNYDMFDVPDRIEIFQGEKLVYESDGFVSGRHSKSINLNGDSGRLKVKLTGNEITSTKWNYTLECP